MARVTLHVDDETKAMMRAGAQAAGLSMSAWLVRLVQAQTPDRWPADVRALAGAWQDLPDFDALPRGESNGASEDT